MGETKGLFEQWMERSDYDLSAAKAVQKSGHYLYVAFMCQQAVEKMLKASWCKVREDTPPYVHNLATIAEPLDLSLAESQTTLLDRLSRYYIVGRYPSFKQKLALELDKKESQLLLEQTEEFLKWCRKYIQMLKK